MIYEIIKFVLIRKKCFIYLLLIYIIIYLYLFIYLLILYFFFFFFFFFFIFIFQKHFFQKYYLFKKYTLYDILKIYLKNYLLLFNSFIINICYKDDTHKN